MESKNMTEKEFEEFQKLLERELGAVESDKEEQEITEMLRHESAAHEAARPARSIRDLNAHAEAISAKTAEERMAQREKAEAELRAQTAPAPQAPVTRGKYEKITEEPTEPQAPKASELIKKPGKYEKVSEDAEGYFNPELPRESASERRRKAQKKTRLIRTAAVLAILFIIGLGIGLIVNSAKKNDDGSKPASAPQSATDSEGNAVPAETTVTTAECNIISITPMTDFTAVIEGETAPLQISMTTSGAADAGDLLWESNDTSVAEVTGDGIVRGISAGDCVITISAKADPSVSAKVNCTVRHMEQIDGVTYVDGILLLNKSYSAPSEYDPGGLTEETQAAFDELCSAAAVDGLNIYLGSGYRSYSTQTDIYNNYKSMYGWEMTDTFSARPGHSEHQSGLAIDVNTIDDAFGETPEAAWLAQHCAEYGFIIRYASDKTHITGYKYEPWHIRYVGTEIAKEITSMGVSLEEYLGVESVYAEDGE